MNKHCSEIVHFCSKCNVQASPWLYENIEWTKDDKIVGLDDKWESFRQLLNSFKKTYSPKVIYWPLKEYTDRDGNRKKGEEPMSAPVMLSNTAMEPKHMKGAAFRDCIDLGRGNMVSVDEPDLKGRTPLVHAAICGNNEQAKLLVEVGKVNVDFCYEMDEPVIFFKKIGK